MPHSRHSSHKLPSTACPSSGYSETRYSARTVPSAVASTIPGRPPTLHSMSRQYDSAERGNLVPVPLENTSANTHGPPLYGIGRRGTDGTLIPVDARKMTRSQAGRVVEAHNAGIRWSRDRIDDHTTEVAVRNPHTQQTEVYPHSEAAWDRLAALKAQEAGPTKHWVEHNVERALRDMRRKAGVETIAPASARGSDHGHRRSAESLATVRPQPTTSYNAQSSHGGATGGRLSRSSAVCGSSNTATRYQVSPSAPRTTTGTSSVPGSFHNDMRFNGYSDHTARPISGSGGTAHNASARYYPPSSARSSVLADHLNPASPPATLTRTYSSQATHASPSTANSNRPTIIVTRRASSAGREKKSKKS